MENTAYLELKQTLKDKYTQNFIKSVGEVSKEFGDKVTLLLGEEYVKLKTEYFTLEEYAENVKTEFFNSPNYIQAKSQVDDLKSQINLSNSDDKIVLDGELHKVLSDLSTLNTTLNNRLKSTREKLDLLKKQIFDLFELNKTELNEIKDSAVASVTEIITAFIKEFNEELTDIKQNFGIDDGKKELPFDFEKCGFITVTDKLQADYFENGVSSLTTENSEEKVNEYSVVSENLDGFSN